MGDPVTTCGAGVDQCIDGSGTYTCNCTSGYSVVSNFCNDVDECSNSTLNSCSADATCTNTDGSYTCACNSGYSGDGANCTDIDECTTGTDTCDANATCSNTAGSYTCACDSGYSGDGTNTCIVTVPINYCYRAGILVNTTSTPTDALVQQAWEDFLTYYKSQSVTFFY